MTGLQRKTSVRKTSRYLEEQSLHSKLMRFAGVLFCFLAFTIGCGGGSGSASGCTGIAAVPGGFPAANRMPNAGVVRLTSNGIGYLSENAQPLINSFVPGGRVPFPPVTGSQSGFDYTMCESGTCGLHVIIDRFDIIPVDGTSELTLAIQMKLRNSPEPGMFGPFRLSASGPLGVRVACNIYIDTERASRSSVALRVRAKVEPENRTPRLGTSKVTIIEAGFAPGQGLEEDDVEADSCGALDFLIDNFLDNQLENIVNDQIAALPDTLRGAVCMAAPEAGCPSGTTAASLSGLTGSSNVCRYNGGSGNTDCLQTLIGYEGQGDLGKALLASVSPATSGVARFSFVSSGAGIAENQGYTVPLAGGFDSLNSSGTQSPGHSSCVPETPVPALPNLPRPTAFSQNNVPGTGTAAQISIGIAEAFINHAMWGMFDSGALCIEAGSNATQALNTSLIAPLAELSFPSRNGALRLKLRPSKPPEITVGVDAAAPLISLLWPALSIDFYTWNTERYVRALTYTADIRLALTLALQDNKLVPSISNVRTENASVTHSEILGDRPETLVLTMNQLIATAVTFLTGGLEGFALPQLAGLQIVVPEGGIRGVASEGNRYLAVAGNIQPPMPAASPSPSPSAPAPSAPLPVVQSSHVELDRASMNLQGFGRGLGNRVSIQLQDLGHRVEVSYRLDGEQWSPFALRSSIELNSPTLLVQGKHRVALRSRSIGTETLSPIVIHEFTVDATAPEVSASVQNNRLDIAARDSISQHFSYRYRLDQGEFSAWQESSHFDLPESSEKALSVDVEARDEGGNIGRKVLSLSQRSASALSCTMNAATSSKNIGGEMFGWAIFGLFAIGWGRRSSRRQKLSKSLQALAVLSLLFVAGCSCGSPAGDGCASCEAAMPPELPNGGICCQAKNQCINYNVDALCQGGFTCPPANVQVDGECTASCSECVRKPALERGILATDLSFVVGADGTRAVAGYSPGVAGSTPALPFGDLVFGEMNGDGAVSWEIVDGVPTNALVTNDPDGWRKGVSEPGDDVGRYTSMVDSGTAFYIAYYDATHRSLRMAIGTPGAFRVHTVRDADGPIDVGRYAQLILREDGKPAIAFVEISPGENGRVNSSVRLALAKSTVPGATTDWDFADVPSASASVPCRQDFCGAATTCLTSGLCVAESGVCNPACTGSTMCVNSVCETKQTNPYVDDVLPLHGAFLRLAKTSTGYALAYFDSPRGELWVTRSGADLVFEAPVLRDGPIGSMATSSFRRGAYLSMAIDGDDRVHLAYQDFASHKLYYVTIDENEATDVSEVDDGRTDVDGAAYTDGPHEVGSDTAIAIVNGEVRIAYQDATSQRLLLATRTTPEGAFARRVIDAQNRTGYWTQHLVRNNQSVLATGFRGPTGPAVVSGIRVVTF